MTYTQKGERVTLEMTRDDFEHLLLIVGLAGGAAMAQRDYRMFWRCMQFANDLNTTNPGFTPYEIPEEFKGHA